jgi:hypothetical protein
MRILILIAVLSVSATAHASKLPLPEEQWTPEAHLWLSRAVVAEAGWLAERDHGLIAWALSYRWEQMVQRYPHMRFVDVVRGYCAGLSAKDAATKRQLWVRDLPIAMDDTKPQGWPRKASWKKHLGYWRTVQQRMLRWGAGKIRDVSHGRVRHWGSADERLPDIHRARRMIEGGKWEVLDVGETENQFYGIARRQSATVVSALTPRLR